MVYVFTTIKTIKRKAEKIYLDLDGKPGVLADCNPSSFLP
jgi:hypothetical protein